MWVLIPNALGYGVGHAEHPSRPAHRCPHRRVDTAGRVGRRRGAHPGPPSRHPHHLLAEGVHPADDAVPRQVRLLHVRPAARQAGVAVPHPRRRARHRLPRRPSRVPRGPVHPRRGSRGPLPGGARLAPGGRVRLHGALPARHGPPRRRRDRPAPARQRRSAARRGAGAVAPGGAQPGDDGRVAARRPRLPSGRARQGTRAAAGDPRGRRRAGDPVHHRCPRRHRRDPRRPPHRCWRRSPQRTAGTDMCRR